MKRLKLLDMRWIRKCCLHSSMVKIYLCLILYVIQRLSLGDHMALRSWKGSLETF